MKKVKLEKPNDIYLSDLRATDNIGFIDNTGEKGYLVYVGDGSVMDNKGKNHLHAVRSSSVGGYAPNMSYGVLHKNRHHTPQGALNFKKRGIELRVVDVFVFDDRKELYLWLSL